jgi:hypothetical protein
MLLPKIRFFFGFWAANPAFLRFRFLRTLSTLKAGSRKAEFSPQNPSKRLAGFWAANPVSSINGFTKLIKTTNFWAWISKEF